MVAKRFFYVCAGILCLALAYHFGAQSATAQAGNAIMVAEPGYVYMSNGDVYARSGYPAPQSWTFAGNIFSGPTPATRETWGGVKAKYLPEGTAKPTQDR